MSTAVKPHRRRRHQTFLAGRIGYMHLLYFLLKTTSLNRLKNLGRSRPRGVSWMILIVTARNVERNRCGCESEFLQGSGERTMTSLVAYDDSDQEDDDGALSPLANCPMDDIRQSQGNQKWLDSNFYGPLLPSPHYKQLEIGQCGDGRTVSEPHREIYPLPLGLSGIVENSSSSKPYSAPQSCVNLTTAKRHQAAPPGVSPYIPKRQRLAAPGKREEPTSLETTDKSTVSRLLTEVSERVRPYLGTRPGRAAVPRCMQLSLQAHQAPINVIQWCPVPQLSHLLLSASMDKTVKIWDGAESGQCLQVYSSHSGAVRDACWSPCGRRLLTGSFDNTAMVTDVETGQQIVKVGNQFKVMCLAVQPDDPEVFLCGGYSSEVKAWDARTCKVERVYRARIQQTLAILFLTGGREFVTSSDSVSRDSAERTLIAWDFQTTAKVSNQIYHERYTCPSLALHPQQDSFVAQSNGNYMALFSAQRPYRMNKRRRYDGHKVEGYAVRCGFSPDGSILATGSSTGSVHFYDQQSARTLHTLLAHQQACMCVSLHPVLPAVVATCDWGGELRIWQ